METERRLNAGGGNVNKQAIWRKGTTKRRRGSALLGILLVVVIIIIIMLVGPFSTSDTKTQVTQAQNDIERSATAACTMNRRTVETDLTQFRIMRDGQMPTTEELRQKFARFQCPRGGAIVIGQDGKVYCTKHAPPPVSELQHLITLFEPQKEATPPPLPEATPMH
jgi:competence protein ComGC